MCNQAVGLIAAEIEKRGIPTVCIALLRSVVEKVGPPRALCVPFPHGYPVGAAGDAEMQRNVIVQALALLENEGPPPVIVDYSIPTEGRPSP